MKPKLVIVICVVAVVGYFGYNTFMKGGPEVDKKNIRDSFQAMSVAIATKNKIVVKNLLSKTFSDKVVGDKELVDILTMSRKLYDAKIKSINLQGDLATIAYTRTEARGEDGSPVVSRIRGETWIRDEKNPMVWRLHRLAANDKWFRTAKIPMQAEPKVVAEKSKAEGVLGTLEKEKKPGETAPGDRRYTAVGKRDPFMPLIALEASVEGGSREVCDPDRPRDLLESYELLSLKLSGIIGAEGKPMALIEAPDGKGYTVRENMYLGKSCGRVIEIRSDEMVVLEKIHKPGSLRGVFEPTETILKIRPEEG